MVTRTKANIVGKIIRVETPVAVPVPGPVKIVEQKFPVVTEKLVDLAPAIKPLADAVSDLAEDTGEQADLLRKVLSQLLTQKTPSSSSPLQFPEWEVNSVNQIRLKKDGKWTPWIQLGSTAMLSLPNPLPVSGTVVFDPGTQTLTERMLAKRPFNANYRLWFDTSQSNYLYTAEALYNAVATDDGAFRGIRVPLDANGNPSGKVEENGAFKWSDKSGGVWN